MPPARKVTRLPEHTAPEPPRPLGSEGRKFWDRIWGLRKNWIDTAVDLDHVALLCESMDERMGLRIAVLRDGSWRDRVALRQLDAQIAALMACLALNPTDRKALSVGGEARGKLAELRAARDT